jgi:hypothetical protein
MKMILRVLMSVATMRVKVWLLHGECYAAEYEMLKHIAMLIEAVLVGEELSC